MYAIDKVTKRNHSFCQVICGVQVCLIPGKEWDEALASEIHVFTKEQFNDRFVIVIEEDD